METWRFRSGFNSPVKKIPLKIFYLLQNVLCVCQKTNGPISVIFEYQNGFAVMRGGMFQNIQVT